MAAGEEQVYTREQMETIFARRQNEHRRLLEDAAELLMPQLERMTDQIAASNHVKEELRRELEELTAAVRLSQERLEQHARQPAHEVGARMIKDLGLETMSVDERTIFPDVMRAAVDERKNAADAEKRQDFRMTMQMVVATGVGSLASLLLFGVGLLAFIVSKKGGLLP